MIPGNIPFARELRVALAAAGRAAAEVAERQANLTHATKDDGSIVTDADLAAAGMIRSDIGGAFPDDAILTEEDADETDRLGCSRCWLVDPIDGTQSYAHGSDNYDVLIGLALEGQVIAGVSWQPNTGMALAATAGGGAWIRPTPEAEWTRLRLDDNLPAHPVIATRFWLGAPANLPHLKIVVNALGGSLRNPKLEAGIRSFLPGKNRIDAAVGLYVPGSLVQANEWDLAAVDIILREAGGAATDLHGRPLAFNKPLPTFDDGLILSRHPGLAVAIREQLARLG